MGWRRVRRKRFFGGLRRRRWGRGFRLMKRRNPLTSRRTLSRLRQLVRSGRRMSRRKRDARKFEHYLGNHRGSPRSVELMRTTVFLVRKGFIMVYVMAISFAFAMMFYGIVSLVGQMDVAHDFVE